MAKLEGQKIADSYEQLLHTDRDGGGNGTTLVDIKDGKNDNTFALKLATDKVRIEKLGIATDSPDGSLHVHTASSGSVDARTDADDLVIENSDHGGISILTPDDKFSNIIFGSPSDSRGAVLDYSHSTKVLNIGSDVASGQVVFKVASSTEAMRIDASGKVGIGTASPSRELSVVSSSSKGGMSVEAANIPSIYLTDNHANVSRKQYVITSNFVEFGDFGIKQSSNATADPHDGTTRFYINNAGNVGIGTTSPSVALDVSGQFQAITNTDGATAGVIRNTHATGYGLKINGASDSTRYALTVNDNDDDTTFFRVLGNGKVEVSAPAEDVVSLEVGGAIESSAGLSTFGSAVTIINKRNSADQHGLVVGAKNSSSFPLIVGRHDTTFNDLVVTGSGKVGIGDTNPDRNLGVKASNASIAIEDTGGGFSELYFADATDSSGYFSYAHGTDILTFGVGGGNRFKLDSNSRISLSNNDSGSGNTVFGKLAGNNLNANASFNLLIGEDAGTSLTGGTNSGDENCIVGTNAVDVASDAFRVTVLGTSAMRGALTTAAEGTVAIGYTALNVLTSGQANTAVGYETLLANTTGQYNTAIGHLSMRTNIDGDHNTALGYASLYSFEAGSDGEGNNVAIGSNASFNLDTGQQNTMVGSSAGQSSAGTITYADNVGVGYKALFAITTGTNNVAIGSQAGDAMTDNVHNVIIGKSAFGSANSGESFNIVIGADAGTAIDNASADNNILIGQDAGTGGSGAMASCIAIGRNAMNSTGTNAQTGTVAIGHDSLTALTSGERNTAIGYASLDAEDAGSNNTAVGYETLTAQNNDTGANTAVGMRAGLAVTTGYSNTLLGSGAGASLQGGYQNTYVGRDADGANGRINSTAVGFGTTAQADNSVTLGNDNVTAVYMASNSGATVYCSGVNFPDTQSASADANTLDDYEEGSWTPVYEAATNSFTTMTMDIISATYTKIGRQVTVRGSIRTDNVSVGSASGTLRLGGLPFDSVATHGESAMVIGHTYNWTSNNFPYSAYNLSGTNQVLLIQRDTSNGATGSMEVGDLTTGASSDQNGMIFSLTYFTD